MAVCKDTVAEWLRRWTRNPLGSARVGSNPTGVVLVTLFFLQFVIPDFWPTLRHDWPPPIAQLVERVTVDRMVPGSIPGRGIIFFVWRPIEFQVRLRKRGEQTEYR